LTHKGGIFSQWWKGRAQYAALSNVIEVSLGAEEEDGCQVDPTAAHEQRDGDDSGSEAAPLQDALLLLS
jgi:hypothetical protein